MSGKSHRKKTVMEHLADFSGYPIEGLTTIPLLDCKWNREIQVTGCCGILEYEDTKVVLKTRRGNCSICGNGLYLDNFHNDILTVHGTVKNICFVEGDEMDV